MNHAQRAMAIRAAQAASRGRRIALSPLLVAANGASRLTPAELRHITGPMTDAVRAFRRAAGTYADWLRLCTARNVGQAIEDGTSRPGTPPFCAGPPNTAPKPCASAQRQRAGSRSS